MTTEVRGASLHRLRKAAVRARYQARHTSLAVGLGLTMRAIYRTLLPGAVAPPDTKAARELVRRFRELLRQDLENVEAGYYPERLLFQFPYWQYLQRMPEDLADLPKLARRKRVNAYRDLPEGVDSDRYPRYYLRNFHWQTDGWLSRRSARLYDLQVEMLFGGTADIMRRMGIPAVIRHLQGVKAPRILDVGCGTGRFLLQLAQALPEARFTGLDLSRPYLREAAHVLEDVSDLSLVADNAEAMPFRDGAFEVVTSVFMFHELPRAVRRQVGREAFRVLEPGGLFMVTDSAQLSDSPDLEVPLMNFAEVYHEPFYREYVRDDLATWLAEVGFEVQASTPHSVSKVVVARKPE